MARYQYCPPCAMGDHENHYKVIHAVSEGMIGGVVCNCKGECRKDAPKRREDMLRQAGLLREKEATTLAVEAQHKTRMPRRWTIHVCPDCGRIWPQATICAGWSGHKPIHTNPVEVVEVIG